MDDSSPAPPRSPSCRAGSSGGGWAPPSVEHLQALLPQYEIISMLGHGGMGAVYKGRQKSLERLVAIKILPPGLEDGDANFTERFKNEARTMARMNHPGIVGVYDFGETAEGQHYFVMEFIDGTDVAKMILAQGKLSPEHALAIAAHVCDALQYAHSRGVIHRDIKPANILLDMEGRVKVADFGLAKANDAGQTGLTKTNMAMGTPDFVAPEALIAGVPLDARADLYAIGVMLYQMLTGKIPRGMWTMPSVMLKTDPRFDNIIARAMQTDREERYQTALDLRRDLDVILTTPAAKTGVQSIPAAQVAAQRSLPQKPVGKGPGAPQQRSADAPVRKESAAKPAAKVSPKKSNAGMIYGIAAAVIVVAAAVFMFAGGGKKAVTAAKPAAPANTRPPPAPTKTSPQPAPKPAAVVPVVTAPVVKDSAKWVDGLAQWFGGTKTNEGFSRKPGEAVRVAKYASMRPLPDSAPLMRDMAVRARVRLGDGRETTEVGLSVRSAVDASGKGSSYNVKIEEENQRVRLGCGRLGTYQAFADYKLPADFNFTTPHTLELRVVGDLLTVTLDGSKLGEHRDTQLTAGHPALAGSKAWIESFEYADLDTGVAPPAVTATPAQGNPVLTFAGHRYQLVTEKLNWDKAKAKAEAMGGHLATITSKEVNDFLFDALGDALRAEPNGIFIGAVQTAEPGAAWKWVTGEPFSFSKWFKSEPNRAGVPSGVSAAAFIQFRKDKGGLGWDDTSATGISRAFLVEWDDDGKTKPGPAAAAPATTSPPADASGAPASLAALRETYRDTLAKHAAARDAAAAPVYHAHLRALDAYVAELTRADRLEGAARVKALRDGVAAQRTAP